MKWIVRLVNNAQSDVIVLRNICISYIIGKHRNEQIKLLALVARWIFISCIGN